MDTMAKLYDYLLYNRLRQWYKPDREQAGAQEKRGCLEHIVTLRLIINTCIKKKLPLFVVYVDFSKAYDMMPRTLFLEVLMKLVI